MSSFKVGRNTTLVLEKRKEHSKFASFLIPIISITLALIFGGIFLSITKHDPVEIYTTMLSGSLGSVYGISETIVKAIPLLLCGLGVSIAFRMKLWNIGAEGQFYFGALAATWVALYHTTGSRLVDLTLMFLAAFVAGGFWALIPAIPRAYFKVNETITTLMLNYVAISFSNFLIYGPWKDPKGYNFPLTPMFPDSAILPVFGETRVHWGLLFGLVAAVILYLVQKYSKWGYELRVIGESPVAAKYAGMNIVKNILLAMFLSGALAGIAGMAEVSGISQRLQPGLSPGYGYTAIIVAWLARLNPIATIVVSFLFGTLLVGGYTMQTSGLSASVVSMLQGAILFFVLGGEIFIQYKLKLIRKSSRSEMKGVS